MAAPMALQIAILISKSTKGYGITGRFRKVLDADTRGKSLRLTEPYAHGLEMPLYLPLQQENCTLFIISIEILCRSPPGPCPQKREIWEWERVVPNSMTLFRDILKVLCN